MSQLFETAERLRAVRRVTRRFTMLWVMERDLIGRVERGLGQDLRSTAAPPSHDDAPTRRCSVQTDREGAD